MREIAEKDSNVSIREKFLPDLSKKITKQEKVSPLSILVYSYLII
jgi:hypothetical protein